MSTGNALDSMNQFGEREATHVGDLNSDAKGSGARKNEGKPQLDLIPVRYWVRSWRTVYHNFFLDPAQEHWVEGLNALRDFQEGDHTALRRYLGTVQLTHAVKVFEFGAHKYKAWNWAKGMPWSVCFGCCLRHAQKRIEKDELLDDDSGETHYGHFLCNLIMLDWYVEAYPEGDDRPLFEEA